jgi:LPS export ABC transporter protein LptC
LAAGLFFSCDSNEMQEVLEFSELEHHPIRSTQNVTYTYTDSGRITHVLVAGRVDRFELPDSSYSTLHNDFSLTFYRANGTFDGRLTARNGYIKGDNSLMIARDSVVFVNYMNETLHTEELIWNQDSATVYTDKFVTIEKDETVIYGKGLVSDQNFTNYVIQDVTGIIYLSENEKR